MRCIRINGPCLFGGTVYGAILLFVGVLAGYFLHLGHSAPDGDSKNDFDKMESPCTVTEVIHREASYTSGHGGATCQDCYSYKFTTATSSDVYTSGERCKIRDNCDDSQLPSWFEEGNAVHCWSPKVKPPPSFYTCHNSECYKIIDPAHESGEAVAWKAGKLLVGHILIGLFVLIVILPIPFLCCIAWDSYSLRKARAKSYDLGWRQEPVGNHAIGSIEPSGLEEGNNADDMEVWK